MRSRSGVLGAMALALVGSGLVADRADARTIDGLEIDSAALGRKLRYAVWLPDELDGRPLPVLYLLHGTGGDQDDWLRYGDIARTMQRLVDDGTVPPMLVVMPDGGDSWYVDAATPAGSDDAAAGQRWASAFIDELVPEIDRRFATLQDRRDRAIAGLSMGGYGAVVLALQHPDLFGVAGSMSGALYRPDETLGDADIAEFKGAFGEPFDPGRLAENSPFELLAALDPADAPAIYLSSGSSDQYGLEENTVLFYVEAKHAGLPVELRVVHGGHDWDYWRRDLPHLLEFFTEHLREVDAHG